jgi:hypothetical protein
MKALCSLEMVGEHPVTQCHVQEHSSLQQHHCGNLSLVHREISVCHVPDLFTVCQSCSGFGAVKLTAHHSSESKWNNPAGYYSGNAADLCLGGAQCESQPGHWLT